MRWQLRILLVGCLVAAACGGGGDDSGTDGADAVGVRLERVAALDDATAMAARPGTDGE